MAGMETASHASMARAARRRPLGRTGIALSALGLGGAPMGGRFGPVARETVRAVVVELLERDLNLVDTAARYSDGRGEADLGAALADVPRAGYVLSCKVAAPEGRSLGDALEASLERLGIEFVDLALLHDPNEASGDELEGAVAQLTELRSRGLARAIGVGIGEVDVLLRAVAAYDVDCVLVSGRYTLLDQSAGRELLPICLERGIGVVLGSAFNSGILATGAVPGARFAYCDAAPPDVVATVRELERLCAERGVPLLAAALQFALAHPAVSSVLVGTTSPHHLGACCDALETPIDEELWQALAAAAPLEAAAVLPGAR
jgi:D-threo-aldose 1-dehydrogenase